LKDIITSSSPSKIILFGEHSVVYGYPAIVAAISRRSFCQIDGRTDNKISINLLDFESKKSYEINDLYNELNETNSKFSSLVGIIKEVRKEISTRSGFNIKIKSDIPIAAGLGSSASIHVSLVNSLNEYFSLNLSKKEISDMAFTGEKDVHGNPSGIDNTIATFGGLLYYQNKQFTHFNIKQPITLIVSNTKIPRNTGDLVSGVRKLYEKEKEKVTSWFQSIEKIVKKGMEMLENAKIDELGELMNENQQILEKLGVSNDKIAKLIEIARNNGALGSKLTGAGGGGCILSLTDENHEKDLLIELNKVAESFKVELDNTGTRIEKVVL